MAIIRQARDPMLAGMDNATLASTAKMVVALIRAAGADLHPEATTDLLMECAIRLESTPNPEEA